MKAFKFLLTVTGITSSIYIVRKIFWYFVDNEIKKKRKELGVDYLKLNRGISFGVDNDECKESIQYMNLRNCDAGKLNYLLDLMNNAKESLDICIYIITNDLISKTIIDAYKRGVKVRVIPDADMALLRNSKIHQLSSEGVNVKYKHSKFIMHHKFVIIDGEILIMGSMNFTASMLNHNWESVIVTSVPKIVMRFNQAFENLWMFVQD